MQDAEKLQVFKQIDGKYKDQWNQTRMIINMWASEPMTLPWDTDDDNTNVQKLDSNTARQNIDAFEARLKNQNK